MAQQLTQQNIEDIDRVQKRACKIILNNKYEFYDKALVSLDLEQLSEKRQKLCKDFAVKADRNKFKDFPKKSKSHPMTTRILNKYEVSHCNTERLKHSAIPQMQRILNTLEE